MKYLYKIFRQYDQTNFTEEYERRIEMPSTIRFNLQIKPMKQPNVYNLYYIPTNDMIIKVAEIYKVSGQLNMIFNKLPPVAKEQFITECLIEELYHTNDLEGVRSTKDEIAQSVKNVRSNRQTPKRFNSMIKSYMNLFNGDKLAPSKPTDIRKIYDDITKGEINETDLPDGDIFRSDLTHVFKKSGSEKVIHRGLIPEEKIHHEIENMLYMMNNMNDVPFIIRVAIGHYFFGYIHPFYDGNGRTSRFISSVFLSKTLGKIPSLALSRGCNKMQNKYLTAFEHANSIMNRGEMNGFIDMFLDIMLHTLADMNMELKEKFELIKAASLTIQHDTILETESQSKFMYILAQNNFFSNNDGLTIKELSHELQLSEATVRKVANELLEKFRIKQFGVRPAYYYIDDTYFEK